MCTNYHDIEQLKHEEKNCLDMSLLIIHIDVLIISADITENVCSCKMCSKIHWMYQMIHFLGKCIVI